MIPEAGKLPSALRHGIPSAIWRAIERLNAAIAIVCAESHVSMIMMVLQFRSRPEDEGAGVYCSWDGIPHVVNVAMIDGLCETVKRRLEQDQVALDHGRALYQLQFVFPKLEHFIKGLQSWSTQWTEDAISMHAVLMMTVRGIAPARDYILRGNRELTDDDGERRELYRAVINLLVEMKKSLKEGG